MAAHDAGPATLAAPERSESFVGATLKGRYRVKALAAVRGDVVVYRAEDLLTGRPITLQVLRDELAGDAEFVEAVREQAWKLAGSAHVHRGVARVYDCGTTDAGDVFVALEPAEGPTLREVLDTRGALDPGTALRLASQVGEALETLHHEDTVHGQLDPHSVVIAGDDTGRHHVTLVGVELTAAYRTTSGRRLRGAVSPAYRAPEQVERGETTEASDVYALGVLLREMLTAGPVGPATDVGAVTAPVPPTIERIIATAVDPRPHHRYPDISVMINDMWGVQAAFAEAQARPSAARRPANAPRRMRPRPPHARRRVAAVAVTSIIVAALVWTVLAHRVVSRVRAGAPAPAAPTVSVNSAASTTSGVPSAPALTGDPRTPRVQSDITESAGLAREVAAPYQAPAALHRQPAVANGPRRPTEPQRSMERPTTPERLTTPERAPRDAGDGTAAIDWLLKERR